MNSKCKYPNIEKWVSYGCTLSMQSLPESKIEVSLGDAGGVPHDGKLVAQSLDEAMVAAEIELKEWRAENKKLLDQLLMGDPLVTEDEYIRVAGWPSEKNPYYKGSER